MDTYLSAQDYKAVIAAILAFPDDLLLALHRGLASADDVKLALGEHGDVWPQTIHGLLEQPVLG